MTNEQAKQEAIKKAYGEKWNRLDFRIKRHLLNVSHWMDMSRMGLYPIDLGYSDIEVEVDCEFWRPIELKGIEDNNGWIRIEPDGSNLPAKKDDDYLHSEKRDYKFIYKIGNRIEVVYYNGNKEHFIRNYTHYKPIEKELLPIY